MPNLACDVIATACAYLLVNLWSRLFKIGEHGRFDYSRKYCIHTDAGTSILVCRDRVKPTTPALLAV